MGQQSTYDSVSAEELAAARRYAMQIEWSPEDQAFLVSFPDVPGVMTHGVTREEAAAMGDDAIITWLTARHDAGLPVPPPRSRRCPVRSTYPESYRPEQIRAIRRQLNVSQQTFAELLNVSVATVRAWEQGVRTPDGAATRLLQIIESHPEAIIDVASPSDSKAA
jgi:predicted RNase H-like HicB family nuclease/DNA-binding XRE family transcriptional regulator